MTETAPEFDDATEERITEYLETFVQHYCVAMLWANSWTYARDDDNEVIRTADEPDGRVISFGDADVRPEDWQDASAQWALTAFDAEARKSIEEDCESFVRGNWADLEGINADQAGHDFALTRNHHGAGFWDRGLGDVGERLTSACNPYGESNAWWDGEDGHLVTLE